MFTPMPMFFSMRRSSGVWQLLRITSVYSSLIPISLTDPTTRSQLKRCKYLRFQSVFFDPNKNSTEITTRQSYHANGGAKRLHRTRERSLIRTICDVQKSQISEKIARAPRYGRRCERLTALSGLFLFIPPPAGRGRAACGRSGRLAGGDSGRDFLFPIPQRMSDVKNFYFPLLASCVHHQDLPH